MKKLIFIMALLQVTIVYANPLTPKDLFSDQEISDFVISQDGKYIAYSMPADNTDMVNILDLDTNELTYSFAMGDDKFVGNLYWGNQKRLLIQPAMKYGSYDQKFLDGTLQAIDPDGDNNTKLYGYRKDFSNTNNVDTFGYYFIESLLTTDTDNILITTYENAEATRKLVKLDINTGRLRTLELSSVRKASLITNDEGELIAQQGITDENVYIISYLNQDDEWVYIKNTENYDLLSSYKNHYLLMVKHLGDNESELITVDRLSGEYETLANFKNIEINNTIRDRERNVIGYVTYDGVAKTTYLDQNSEEAKLHKLLEQSFPNSHIVIRSTGPHSTKSFVSISSDKEPGSYYLFDSENKKLRLLSKDFNKIERDQFSLMSPVSFEARDGLTIPAYVTLPHDFKGASPTVILVHGGPFGVRDRWGFNKKVQLLASNGYAVMQINYRGSGDYGEEFEIAGHRQWGKTMQDDITDGTQWAIDSGIADKDNICIYGGSYGGYAALMGVVKEPELYQCAIGFVGVYDLLLQSEVGDIRTRSEGRAFIEETIGTDEKDLAKYSPARHVDKIKADLLLIHGEKDARVPFEHYETLTEALEDIDYPYESLVKSGEGHGFADNDNQIELYTKILKFLNNSIGNSAK